MRRETRHTGVAAAVMAAALASGCVSESQLRADFATKMSCPLDYVSAKQRLDVANPDGGDLYEVSGCAMRMLVGAQVSGRGFTRAVYLSELTEKAVARGELRLTAEEKVAYTDALHRRDAARACAVAGALSGACTTQWSSRRLEGDVALALAAHDLACPLGQTRIVSALPVGQQRVNPRFIVDGCGQRAVYVSTCTEASDPAPPAGAYPVEVLIAAELGAGPWLAPWRVPAVRSSSCAYLLASRTTLAASPAP